MLLFSPEGTFQASTALGLNPNVKFCGFTCCLQGCRCRPVLPSWWCSPASGGAPRQVGAHRAGFLPSWSWAPFAWLISFPT